MSLHLRERTGGRKPSFPSRINWKYPSTVGLVLALPINERNVPINNITMLYPTVGYTSFAMTPFENGIEIDPTAYYGTAEYRLAIGNMIVEGSSNLRGFSVAFKIKHTSTLTNENWLGCTIGTSYPFGLKHNATSHVFQIQSYTGSATLETLDASTSISLNQWYEVFCTYRVGGKKKIWVNRVLENEDDVTNGNIYMNTGLSRFGNMSSGTFVANKVAFEYAFAWLRELPYTEITEFYKNPYAMFESKARYFWNVPVEFSKGLYTVLPSGTTRLPETVSEVKVNSADTSYDELDAENRLGIFQFKNFTSNTTQNITGSWVGKIDLAASINPIYLAAYNFNASSWETKASNNTVATGTNFTLSAAITASPSNYYSNSAVLWRVYQSGGDNVSIRFWDNLEYLNLGWVNANNFSSLGMQYVVIPKAVSFSQLVMGASITSSTTTRSIDMSMGFFSLIGNIFSLFSSWTASFSYASSTISVRPLFTNTLTNSFVVPAGSWYFGYMVTMTNPSMSLAAVGVTSTVGQIWPRTLYATMTTSTSAFPSSVDADLFDKVGLDVIQAPYILIS
jgi:hypothetical protein